MLNKGAWIITGGTHAGVMKYVGEAVRDYALASGTTGRTNVIAIGIASWGVLDQRETLMSPKVCTEGYFVGCMYERGLWENMHYIFVASGTTGRTNVIAIGIASWGVLDQRETLMSPKVCTKGYFVGYMYERGLWENMH